jgi:hypothetical protein
LYLWSLCNWSLGCYTGMLNRWRTELDYEWQTIRRIWRSHHMCQKGSNTECQYSIREAWHQSHSRPISFFRVMVLPSFMMNKIGYRHLRRPMPSTLLQTSKVMVKLPLYEPWRNIGGVDV